MKGPAFLESEERFWEMGQFFGVTTVPACCNAARKSRRCGVPCGPGHSGGILLLFFPKPHEIFSFCPILSKSNCIN